MSPRALGVSVAALTAVLWAIGALPAPHPLAWTSLDLRWYFYPQYEAFYGALRDGAPMAWNPYQLGGMPLLGTLQAGFFYPFHVLYLLLPTPWALAASIALHVALAAGTAAAFGRRAGLSSPAAMLAGIVFATAGTMRHWQLWPYLLEASAWLPLGAIGVLDVTGDRRARGVLLLASANGLSWLAGGPQGTAFAIYAWTGLLAARLLFPGDAAVDRPRAVLSAAAALVAGGLVGTVALWPAYELANDGVRVTRTLAKGLLYPVATPQPSGVVKMWIVSEPWAMRPALALAPFGLLAGPRWLAAWAVVVGGLALLLALGPGTPAFPLYHVLPVIGWFREPGRLLLIAGFAMSVLAGRGLDMLAGILRVGMLRYAAAVVVVAAVAIHGLRMPPPPAPVPFDRGAVPWTPAQHDAYVRLAQISGSDRVWPLSPTIWANSLPPKLASITRLRSIEDYEPLPLRRQSEFFAYFLEGSPTFWDWSDSFEGRMVALRPPKGREPPAARRRLLDLMATRFVLLTPAARRRADVAAFVRDAGLRPAPTSAADLGLPEYELLENPHALPRAYVTYRASRSPRASELLSTLSADTFDPLVESWVEADTDVEPPGDAPPRGAPATIVRDEPNVVELRATLAAPGLVVLADTYDRGWRATIDGVATPILATNHLFRGVRAPAGEHVVRFEYRPRSVIVGGALSLVTAVVLCVLGWRTRARGAA